MTNKSPVVAFLKEALTSELSASWIDPRQLETRILILEAALEILITHGVSKLTLAELARQSKLSKPRIAYHYDDMAIIILDLLRLLTRSGQEITAEEVQRAKNPLDKVIASARGAIHWIEAAPGIGQFLIIIYAVAAQNSRIFELHQKIVEKGRHRIERNLVDHGLTEVKARALSIQIQALILGNMMRSVSLRDATPSQTILLDMEAQIRAWVVESVP